MKENKLLTTILALSLLTGCGGKEITTTNSNFSGSETATMEMTEQTQFKTFEPGEHIITIVCNYNLNNTQLPSPPEGYEFAGISKAERDGMRVLVVYINTEKVEAEGIYDSYKEEYVYPYAGQVVKQLTLNNNN